MSLHPLRAPFVSQVPDLIMNQANTDIERYMLEQLDIMRQQNQAQIEVTIAIEQQTRLTNGRVTKHDQEIEGLRQSLKPLSEMRKQIQRYWKIIAFGFGVVGPIAMVLFVKWVDVHGDKWFR